MSRIIRSLTVAVTSAFTFALGGIALAASPAAPTTQPYPLTTCIVSDEKLGEMGEPVVLKHGVREVRLCCKGCVGPFEKDPAKYMKKLDEAAAAAPSTQPAPSQEK